jgi:dolichyl-phosphate beta-glucosyltransferase
VNPYLSVVIPAYNEEQRLPETLRHVLGYLSARTYSAEVLVADDGSRDSTPEIVKSWPVGRGIVAAAGDFRLFMDADNSTAVEQVERFWPLFEQGYDLLIGSRKTAGAHVALRQPFHKEFAGRMGNLVIQALAVPGIVDTQAGFKIFTRRSVEIIFPRLTIERWGVDIEILVVARTHRLRFREVPITWVNCEGSKVNWKTYFQVLSEVWHIRRNRLSGLYR